jgi:hypothetical protein
MNTSGGIVVQTNEEKKQYHLKILQKLCEESHEVIPYLVEPTDEQKQWVLRRLKQPSKYWQRWFVGQYFKKEQKEAMGLTDNDIAGKGMRYRYSNDKTKLTKN